MKQDRYYSKRELIGMAVRQKGLNVEMGRRLDLITGLVKGARLPWWETKGRRLLKEIAEVLVSPDTKGDA